MEILQNYYGWITLALTLIILYLIKRLSKNPDAGTSKYIAELSIQGQPKEIAAKIETAMRNSGFKNIRFDKNEKAYFANTKFSMSSVRSLYKILCLSRDLPIYFLG